MSDAAATALAAWPALRSLRRLSVEGIQPAGIRALATSPYLTRLEVLGLKSARFDAASADALASSATLTNLHQLDMVWGSALAVRALATTPGLPRLAELSLLGSAIEDRAAAELLRSPHRTALRAVDLERASNIGGETLASLAEGDRFFRSGSLNLWACKLRDQDIRPLVESPHAVLLRELLLGYSHLTDAGARMLAGSPYLKNLRRLSLYANELTGVGVAAVADPAAFPNVTVLDVGGNGIGDEGALALVRWARAHGMTRLDLARAGLSAAGASALAQDEGVAGLLVLNLGGNPFGDAGVRALAASPHVAGLRRLSLYGVGMTDAGAIALATSPHLSDDVTVLVVDNPLGPEAKQALRDRFGSGAQML